MYRKYRDEIEIILLDMTMPHMDGKEAFRELTRINPDVKVVMCSGYTEHDVSNQFLGKGIAGFVQKPYDSTDLKKKLAEALMPKDE